MTDEITRLKARVKVLEDALQIARTHVANNAQGWSVGRAASRADLSDVDAALAVLAASQTADPVTNAGCHQQVKVKTAVDVATEAVWREFVDSREHKWTFRKEHVRNAIVKSLAALEPAPVTLANALQVPEVQVLVEAAMVAKLALAEHEPHPLSACQSLLAALRPFKGGKA